MSRSGEEDEFYTQLSLVEDEVKHYKAFFRDKVVFCNCDDSFESNFFKYFAMNFNLLGLKKLIATCYATSPIVYTQLNLFSRFKRQSTILSVTTPQENAIYSVIFEEKPPVHYIRAAFDIVLFRNTFCILIIGCKLNTKYIIKMRFLSWHISTKLYNYIFELTYVTKFI